MAEDLPAPARRWLTHAIQPGTPLAQTARLTMHGTIRAGTWRPFWATEILRPPHGFLWAVRCRMAGLPVTGFNRYSEGVAQMRWRLLGVIPVMSASKTGGSPASPA